MFYMTSLSACVETCVYPSSLFSTSSFNQLRFLEGREAREAIRSRKTALLGPITPRQSALHVIVFGIHI